jgi:hypothetical protein
MFQIDTLAVGNVRLTLQGQMIRGLMICIIGYQDMRHCCLRWHDNWAQATSSNGPNPVPKPVDLGKASLLHEQFAHTC